MKVNDFDYDILKKTLAKVPNNFELERIEFDKISYKIFVSVNAHEDYALKRATENFKIQQEFLKQLKGE